MRPPIVPATDGTHACGDRNFAELRVVGASKVECAVAVVDDNPAHH